MKKPFSSDSTNANPRGQSARGFTLMETVIAIGVLAVLLTGFIAVFAPAAQGIKRSINSQQADRLSTTLERELVTYRKGQNIPLPPGATTPTGFDKAFDWIDKADDFAETIFVYQYRGDPSGIRDDGTPEPLASISGQPGKNYTIQSMARRASDPLFTEDLDAIEGAIFYVKPIQLIYDTNKMTLGTIGTIANPVGATAATAGNAAEYEDAVIAFSAEFYSVPSKSKAYLVGANKSQFEKRFNTAKRPVFSRNLAVRR